MPFDSHETSVRSALNDLPGNVYSSLAAGPHAEAQVVRETAERWGGAQMFSPLMGGGYTARAYTRPLQLNLSALYGRGVARRGCVACVKGVLGGVQGVKGAVVCQTRLKLS